MFLPSLKMDDLRSILILGAFLRTDGKPAVGGEGYFCKYCCKVLF